MINEEDENETWDMRRRRELYVRSVNGKVNKLPSNYEAYRDIPCTTSLSRAFDKRL